MSAFKNKFTYGEIKYGKVILLGFRMMECFSNSQRVKVLVAI
jgi:hypothetical protein